MATHVRKAIPPPVPAEKPSRPKQVQQPRGEGSERDYKSKGMKQKIDALCHFAQVLPLPLPLRRPPAAWARQLPVPSGHAGVASAMRGVRHTRSIVQRASRADASGRVLRLSVCVLAARGTASPDAARVEQPEAKALLEQVESITCVHALRCDVRDWYAMSGTDVPEHYQADWNLDEAIRLAEGGPPAGGKGKGKGKGKKEEAEAEAARLQEERRKQQQMVKAMLAKQQQQQQVRGPSQPWRMCVLSGVARACSERIGARAQRTRCASSAIAVSYTHLRAHETEADL
eukprot:3403037-Rhodomonas_salina.1